jgi:hypothetical protein
MMQEMMIPHRTKAAASSAQTEDIAQKRSDLVVHSGTEPVGDKVQLFTTLQI